MSSVNQEFTTPDILKATGGQLAHGFLDISFGDISTDSRKIKTKDLFVALEGKNFNGHNFISQAFERGAFGAIVRQGFLKEFQWNEKGTLIEVKDPLMALGDIAHYWRMKHPVSVVGITGSNGKTTTKEMIAKILEFSFNTLKTEGNFNNLIGLPLTLLRLRKRDEIAILEMGTNTRSEIKRLAEISMPDVGVITNIGQAHLQGFQGIEEVMEEKGALFKAIGEDGFIIINQDDMRVHQLASECKCRKVSFGILNAADLMADEISISDSGQVDFRISCRNESVNIHSPFYGVFSVYNALAAAGVAQALGVGLRDIKKGLESLVPLPGRMEVSESKGYTVINDTYNANPNSMDQALRTLVKFRRGKRTIAVLGDMLELGEFSKSAHIQIGRLVFSLGIDYLFTLGSDSIHIAQGASEAGMNTESIYIEKDHRELASKVKPLLRQGDCVLIKGSRGMKMELVLEEL